MLTPRMAAAITEGRPLCLLAEIDHPSGVFRCWSGIGDLTYNDLTWKGIGNLGQVEPVRQSVELNIQEVQLTLSGADPEAVALLDGTVRNRFASVWLACLDTQGKIVRDPYQLLDLQLDYQRFIAQDDGTVHIIIVARSGFYTLERAVNEVWSDENQKKRFSGDTGLGLLTTLQNQEVIWTP